MQPLLGFPERECMSCMVSKATWLFGCVLQYGPHRSIRHEKHGRRAISGSLHLACTKQLRQKLAGKTKRPAFLRAVSDFWC